MLAADGQPHGNHHQGGEMRTALRVAMASAIAALTLLAAVTTASANSLSVDDQDFTIRWAPLSFIAGGSTTRCNLTLSGSFHSARITKTANLLIGHVTSTRVESCNAGASATVLTATLPWHVRYQSFSGTLPSITAVGLTITGIGFRFDPEGALPACLFRTEATEPFRGSATLSSGRVTAFAADATQSIDLENEEFLCSLGGDLEFSGTGAIEDTAGNAPNISLIGGADLSASPSSVVITREESSDTFSLRNIGGATATIDVLEDEGATQFDVTGCGAGRTIAVGASCVYTIEVDSRPLASGTVTVTYDDGAGGTRRVSVEVDIEAIPVATLTAEPSSVVIEQLEQNDIVEVRNTGSLTATVDRITTTTSDVERPDFTVTTTGCRERLAVNEACHYLISVNSRPETSGRITVEYDDGAGGNRSLVIEVDIAGPDPGELEADPTEVNIERLEANEAFVLRNISPDTAVVVDRTTLTTDDSISPEFSVTGIGCTEIYVAGASCTYIVSVNSRPEPEGTYVIEYDDGAGSNRRVTVNVDIAS